MDDLQGRTALVTGAAHGIGRALAERAAAEGMNVALVDVDAAALDAAAGVLRDRGTKVHATTCDVTDAAAVRGLADEVEGALGPVDLVCSNAGVATGFAPTWDVTADEWQRVFAVNVFGALNVVQVFVPRMLARGDGHLLVTSSLIGLQTGPFSAAYCASKHATTALAHAVRAELQVLGAPVEVSILCPHRVDTDMAARTPGDTSALDLIEHPMNVACPPEHVAAVAFDGIRRGGGYLFTHADAPVYVRETTEQILDGALAVGS